MTAELRPPPGHEESAEQAPIEMPKPTAWPMVVALGLAFAALGLATVPSILVVGAVILVTGLVGWVHQMLPGEGHLLEERVDPLLRPGRVAARPGTVERLVEGMPGYRMRLPLEVHPLSAGVWGGLAGGLLMPLPALAWGLLSGHGIWYPVNLLAGMVLPGVGQMSVPELEQLRPGLLAAGVIIHLVICLVVGLCYGVLMPTLPSVPTAVAWGGLLIPIVWTALSYSSMHLVNPVMAAGVDWPWFVASQLVFGLVSAAVFVETPGLPPVPRGLLAGAVGGLVMPGPAFLWGLVSRHGIWYPVNLLAGMVVPSMDRLPVTDLEQFHAGWFAISTGIHATLSLCFGLAYPFVLPRVRPIPGPLAWGGLVLPMLWTGFSFGLMGVVNPVLQQRVDWPWFILSQFVFGVTAALVVVRSEMIAVPPAGSGPTDPNHAPAQEGG